ncbi:MAG: hypothetical protein EWV46_03595 [Microcystis viridis Mv_BB_P_19951000_S69D]|uniref:Uncharacterized protein n=1 Tax=Microcystis viridis Mv_BB_P_19951000_S68D TaxID=2486270 RepID=A0A552H5S5_MICVR|nr:MAG: hypothetical protein EWV77_24235 [Microcystis viridis Mv_BB_P_19951000_S68D]TRU89567.1 MAG: hypothetical protein EWV46_03595 [Microcystis viridis Mv_BB_P_19951000_S69D]
MSKAQKTGFSEKPVFCSVKCAWCVPQKSISGAVGATLGNAPYSDRCNFCPRAKLACFWGRD